MGWDVPGLDFGEAALRVLQSKQKPLIFVARARLNLLNRQRFSIYL
jgi:hypothetical protein